MSSSCDNHCYINCHRILTRFLREDLLKKSDAAEFGEIIRTEFSHLIYREKHREENPTHKEFCRVCKSCLECIYCYCESPYDSDSDDSTEYESDSNSKDDIESESKS